MSDIAIRVAGISKEYRIGAAKRRHDTLRDELAHRLTSAFRRGDRRDAGPKRFWALRDVSFDVKQGEVLGIIGRNGAGKSTLLKVLSRITAPTRGSAEIYGRIGSLLEVGTGFSAELTGRENIYLNGAIMGMRRAEIDRKFDEIVSFAEVDAFIDTPVKRYSSGMYLRLAFAVAAHLEPEILIVDEVLAVGDAVFQKKCMGKMGDVARGGRTVILVSHNMSAMLNLCKEAAILANGELVFLGGTDEAVQNYLSSGAASDYGFADISEHLDREPGMLPIARAIGLRTGTSNDYSSSVRTGDDLVFEIHYDCHGHVLDQIGLAVSSLTGQRVFTVGSHLCPDFTQRITGTGILECHLPNVALAEGEYTVTVMMGKRMPPHNIDYLENAMRFRVELGDFFGTGGRLFPGQGFHAQKSQWAVRQDRAADAPVVSI
jgi:lipopolysaccharide transport system ATP-binding protein